MKGIGLCGCLMLPALALMLFAGGCGRDDPDAAAITVDFSWEGMAPCGWGNPAIRLGEMPGDTKYLVLSMFDHAYNQDHGRVRFAYAGEGRIAKGRFETIQGPCPSWTPGRYEITIEAVGANNAVIGIGRKTRVFPE